MTLLRLELTTLYQYHPEPRPPAIHLTGAEVLRLCRALIDLPEPGMYEDFIAGLAPAPSKTPPGYVDPTPAYTVLPGGSILLGTTVNRWIAALIEQGAAVEFLALARSLRVESAFAVENPISPAEGRSHERSPMNWKRILIGLSLIAIVGSFVAGLAAGHEFPDRFRWITGFPIAGRYIQGHAGLVRAQVLESGESGLGDIIDVLAYPEILMETDDARAAMLMPGDSFIAYCQITGDGASLRIHGCRFIPVVDREVVPPQ
jgi:hypothetical protein